MSHHSHDTHHHDHHRHEHGDYEEGHGHTHGVVDPSITTTAEGLWALKWSFVVLVITALLRLRSSLSLAAWACWRIPSTILEMRRQPYRWVSHFFLLVSVPTTALPSAMAVSRTSPGSSLS